MQQLKTSSREELMGRIILGSIIAVIITLIGINLLNVKVVNIEAIDRGLYTIVTEKGNVNIQSENILRVERTYSKEAFTGEPIELDKIYTDKGFIYVSSSDSFAEVGRDIINSVDFYGLPTWERADTDWQTVKPYSYSIGTPEGQVPLLFFLISLQYIALTVGGIALTLLIFPHRLNESASVPSRAVNQQEQESLSEETYNAVAK